MNEVITRMREVANVHERARACEREEIINLIEHIEDCYRANGLLERATVCRGIIEQLRYS